MQRACIAITNMGLTVQLITIVLNYTMIIKGAFNLKYALFCKVVITTPVFIKTLTSYISLKCYLLANYKNIYFTRAVSLLGMITIHLRKDFYVKFKEKMYFLLTLE